jgi:hypothetical protein
MSRKKYDKDQVKKFAADHTITECAEHYDVEIDSMYTWFSKHHINYRHTREKGNKHEYVRKITDREFDIAQMFGRLQPKTQGEGWFYLSIGVLAFAEIDGVGDFPTRKLFEYLVKKRMNE